MKKIKEFFAVLLITVFSISTVAFAEDTEYEDDAYIQNTQSILQTNFVSADYDTCKYYADNQVGFVKDAFEAYIPFIEGNTLGEFVEFGDSTVDRSQENTVICNVIVVYENGQIKSSVEYKLIAGGPTPVSITFSSADTDNKSLGEKMANAGLNTLIGICTVVVVLLIIMFFISLFKFIPVVQEKFANRKKTSAADVAVDNAIAQITENEELVDDYELVAVITAAVSAATGTSSDGFVVRSIRKVKRSR